MFPMVATRKNAGASNVCRAPVNARSTFFSTRHRSGRPPKGARQRWARGANGVDVADQAGGIAGAGRLGAPIRSSFRAYQEDRSLAL